MKIQEGIRISYQRDSDDSTHIVFVPLREGSFPKALQAAVDEAARLLVLGLGRDLLGVGPDQAQPLL